MVENIKQLMRPVAFVLMLALTSYCVYKGEVTGKDVLGLLGMMIGFYFGERAALKNPQNGVESKPPTPPNPII